MSNRLEKLKRVPSDLRRYCKYIWQLKSEEGSVMSFILRERVKWSNLETSENMHFDNPGSYSFLVMMSPAHIALDDYKILYNDWPYGVDPRIVHLVVWTKFPYEEDPETGFLTHGAYQEIDSFVEVTFRHRLENPSHVLWFRNWTAIQSVKALPHFHVMLYDPPSDLIKEVTGNDVPMVQKVKENEVDRVQC